MAETNSFFNVLQQNGYQTRVLKTIVKRKQSKTSESEDSPSTDVVLAYIRGVSEPIKRILSGQGLRIAFKSVLTISHILKKPKDPLITKDQKRCCLQDSLWIMRNFIYRRNKAKICDGNEGTFERCCSKIT